MSKLNPKKEQSNLNISKKSIMDKTRQLLVSCLLFEDNTYMDGKSAVELMTEYIEYLSEAQCRSLLRQAKNEHLRHAPAFWAIKMLKKGYLRIEDLDLIIDRVDIMIDLLSLYWSDNENKHSVPKILQKGLAKSFKKFDEYQFAKYKANKKAISLKDVLRLSHPIPENEEQSLLYKKIVSNTLKTPDTWEVAISKCKTPEEKKKEWERLLIEKTEKGFNKLGGLALIRNLKGMRNLNIDFDMIEKAIENTSMKKILPYQLLIAINENPQFSKALEKKLFESISQYDKLKGHTLFLVDVSGSMYNSSERGNLMMVDNAVTTAAIVNQVCEKSTIFGFDTNLYEIDSSLTGVALMKAIRSLNGDCTAVIDCTNNAIQNFKKKHSNKFPERVIVITDEGENSSIKKVLMNLPKSCKGYMVNVASNANEVSFNKNSGWCNVSGWSTSLMNFITENEKL